MAIKNDTIWLSKSAKSYPKWNSKMSADVAIIGGGIAGVTAAYLLSKSNLKVMLIEKNKIGQGATGYTTAMITQYIDTSITDLVDMFGAKQTKLIWESGGVAIDLIEHIIKKEKIECEFMRAPYYITAEDLTQLQEEYTAAKKLDINVAYKNNQLEIPNQAKFHPVKYIRGLAAAAANNGVLIFENSSIDSIKQIKAKNFIVATHLPFNKPLDLFFKKAKYKTYMLYAKIQKGAIKEALYQDTQTPYHYYRIDKHKSFDTVLLGGEDHRADIPVDPKKHYKALEKYLQTLTKKYTLLNKWDGPIIETIDGLPYIGPLHGKKNIFYATGFSGNGMTFGTLSGHILADLLQGKKNKYYNLYKANRIPTIKQLWYKGKDYMEVFLGGVLKNIIK